MTRIYFPDFLHRVSPLQDVMCGVVCGGGGVVCDLNKTIDITILYQLKYFSGCYFVIPGQEGDGDSLS